MLIISFLQILLLILFLIVSLFLFTFPGIKFLKFVKVKLSGIDLYVLSTILGVSAFTLITYLLSIAGARDLIWLLILFGVIEALRSYKLLPDVLQKVKENFFSLFSLVLIMGVLSSVSINAFSGLYTQQGLFFYSAHGHDGLWHIALIEQMAKENYPFTNPEYAGYKLQNYHFYVDLLMSEISRITYFSPMDLYFRFVPFLFSVLFGLICFMFVKKWSGKYISGIWSMVFVFFLGNFGYVLTYLRNKDFNGESVFWMQQLFSLQGNPPQAAAVLMITALAYCILRFLRDKEKNYFLPIVIIGSALVEFKVYAGVAFIGALLFASAYELIIKKNFLAVALLLAVLIPSALISLPNSKGTSGYLIFEPWWFVRTMVVAQDKLNWMDLELQRQTYLYENNLKRVVQVELIAFIIYVTGNLGVRILGLWQGVKMLLNKRLFNDSFDLFFLSIIILSFGIPMIFLQKGVVYNIIQISQYMLLFLSFLSALTLGEIFARMKNKWSIFLLSAVVISLGIPTQIGLLWGFYSRPPVAVIDNNQIQALEFLKNNSQNSDIILTSPFDRYLKEKYNSLPLPINVWSDTGYVSAISARKTLVADQEQLQIMGYAADELFNERKEVFESKDFKKVNEFLQKYRIKYIYLEKGEGFASDSAKLNIERIYNKDGIKIYKVSNI